MSQSDADAASLYAKRRTLFVEEGLIQAGYMNEARLLKFQANFYKTHFVSTQKLASAPISDALLKLIPHKLANRYCVFPVRFDPKGGELMILTVQPDDIEVIKNVQWATRVPKVRALVARPAAIQAAIQVHYEDEPQAFANIRQSEGGGIVSERDRGRAVTQTYEQPGAPGRPRPPAPPGAPSSPTTGSMPPIQSLGPAPMAPNLSGPPGGPPPPPNLSGPPAPPPPAPPQVSAPPAPPPQVSAPPMPPPADSSPGLPPFPEPSMPPADPRGTGGFDPQPFPSAQPNPPQPNPGQAPGLGMPGPMSMPSPQISQAPPMQGTMMGQGVAFDPTVQAPPMQPQPMQPQPMQPQPMPMQPTGTFPDPNVTGTGEAAPVPMPSATQEAPPKKKVGIAMHDYLETLNVLVALLESERGDLRGHSVSVARLSRRFCERLGVAQLETDSVIAAAYLHDIGKTSAFHLTALNVAQYEQHRNQAKKSYLTPVRVFESVRLPEKVSSILTHMYERHDGQGFPDHLTGKEIVLGARILAIVETYADLTGHAGNAFRKRLSAQEAWDVLAKYKGKVFDANLVDVFKLVVLGDDLRAKLLSDVRRALVIDSDPEETTILELRLIEHGYEVTIARNGTEAENELNSEFDVIISEVDVEPEDGFALLKRVRDAGTQTPWVFVSRVAEGDTVQKAFELGADEFIAKPASPDVVALKIGRVIEGGKKPKKRTGGVSGSLTEMALPDVVQILYHGRKSGRLSISASGKEGEILFSEGQIFEAKFGSEENEVAFYEMLSLVEGDFELDPGFQPTERKIEMNPESLLLEGMRRLDEVGR